MRQCYEPITLRSNAQLCEDINEIAERYQAQDLVLTVRQLYYQLLVGGKLKANSKAEYQRVDTTLNNGRMGGLIDWDAFEDRTRAFTTCARYDSYADMLEQSIDWFHMDLWANQPYRPFVLVEKQALSGVISGICEEYDVPWMPVRGYSAIGVLRDFARRHLRYGSARQRGQFVIVYHLGDHDPSGMDATRDLRRKLALFAERKDRLLGEAELQRICLNMEQVVEEELPDDFEANRNDARYDAYCRDNNTDRCWELDALEPSYFVTLLRETFDSIIVKKKWKARLAKIETEREHVRALIKEMT